MLVEVLDSPSDDFEELRRVPAVDVDGSLAEPLEGFPLLIRSLAEGFVPMAEPLDEVGFADLVYACPMFGHQVRKRCGRSTAVHGPVPVGEQDERDTLGPQHAVDLGEESQGLRQVLQHVAGDDEILTGVGDGGEPIRIEVGDHVRFREFSFGCQLREEVAALSRLPAVDVQDPDTGKRELERVVAGAHFDARTHQMPGQQFRGCTRCR